MTPEEIVQKVMKRSKTMTRPVYRGQANADWELESGAVRRLRKAYGKEFPTNENELRKLVNEYHRESLITPMQVVDGDSLSNLQRLSVLQHQGAATGLLDFTEYLLASLWFACEEESSDKNAKVFILDIGNPQITKNARNFEDPFVSRPFTMYYEPDRSLGNRIIAQQSVLVICNPRISDEHIESVVVPKTSKRSLQDYLKRLGLSQKALFGDIPGLAAANTVQMPLQRTPPLTPRELRDRGNRRYQAGQYDAALAEYEDYAAALPGVAEPYCLKGDALVALQRYDDAERAYTTAIKNLDKPIDLGDQVIVNQGPRGREMRRALYYNRGNVRAVVGDHGGAVKDFDAALQHGYKLKRDVLRNRGNSKFSLRMFKEAYQDFEAASFEEEGSDVALAMGNCKVRMGEFDDALRRYMNGVVAGPEISVDHCRANAAKVRQILDVLNEPHCEVKNEENFVLIEIERALERALDFPIAGNQGNTGNIPSGMVTARGGKGYKGMGGFAVKIVSSAGAMSENRTCG